MRGGLRKLKCIRTCAIICRDSLNEPLLTKACRHEALLVLSLCDMEDGRKITGMLVGVWYLPGIRIMIKRTRQ